VIKEKTHPEKGIMEEDLHQEESAKNKREMKGPKKKGYYL
jgi:hypothetical protein